MGANNTFKKCSKIGPGGLNCRCCNPWGKNRKSRQNRWFRRTTKQNDRKID